jgi:hypothetical protein
MTNIRLDNPADLEAPVQYGRDWRCHDRGAGHSEDREPARGVAVGGLKCETRRRSRRVSGEQLREQLLSS